jgi:hypothetical protein
MSEGSVPSFEKPTFRYESTLLPVYCRLLVAPISWREAKSMRTLLALLATRAVWLLPVKPEVSSL